MKNKSIKNEIKKLIPDSLYLRYTYKKVMGKPLNLKNPKTFNEKLQWLKLHDRRPEYIQMVDKYEAKKYVAAMIGEEYIIPTLGIYDHFEEIDFSALPDQFVLKCTHDSGGGVICREKEKFDLEDAKQKLDKSLKNNFYWNAREWPYKYISPRIIVEKYMEDENETKGLRDYKFFCFNQEPKMVYLSEGLENHETASISFYDLAGKEMPFRRNDYKPICGEVKFPDNFQEMIKIVKIIAKEIKNPFVRIDLYSIKGAIYFSEITFYPCAGWLPFEPEAWDEIVGNWMDLSDIMTNG